MSFHAFLPPAKSKCKLDVCKAEYPRNGAEWNPHTGCIDEVPITPVPPFCCQWCAETFAKQDPATLAKNVVPGRLRHPNTHYRDNIITVRVYTPHVPFAFDELPDCTQYGAPPPLMEDQRMRWTCHDELDGNAESWVDLVAVRRPDNHQLYWIPTSPVQRVHKYNPVLFPRVP